MLLGRRPSLICIAASLTVGMAAGCNRSGDVHHKIPIAVRVESVSIAHTAPATRYSASIHPAMMVDVAFRVGGYVQQIARIKGIDGHQRLLQEGDHVPHGMQLASVRQSDYQQKLSEGKAAVDEAVAAKEQAQLDYDRATKLAQNQSITQAELDGARARLNAALAHVEGGSARMSEAQTALQDTTLRAPIDGVILRRYIEVGALAPPGTIAFTVADLDTVKAAFGVPDTVVDTLRLGSVQSITTEAMHGAEFQGRITRIAPSADPKSRVFEIEVSIANERQELRPGMVAVLNLSAPSVASTPIAVLPLSAVVRSPLQRGEFAVFVVEPHDGVLTARVREVQLGEFLGNTVPIKTGVAGGEKVVVSGATLLADGEIVQVIP